MLKNLNPNLGYYQYLTPNKLNVYNDAIKDTRRPGKLLNNNKKKLPYINCIAYGDLLTNINICKCHRFFVTPVVKFNRKFSQAWINV